MWLWTPKHQPWKSSEVMGSLMSSGAPSIRATAASRLSFITATWRAVSPRAPEWHKLANEERMLHQNEQRTKVFAAQPHLSQICWWRSSRAVSWCSLHYSFGPHRREECCLCWEERRRKNVSESFPYEYMGNLFSPNNIISWTWPLQRLLHGP